jgi:serine/threonine-protein kinase
MMGRDSCIKVFYALKPEAANVAQAIHRGVRGVASINHPNIVRIFDFAAFDLADASSFYLVMEYVSGMNLAAWIGDREPKETVPMAYKIAQALQVAHQRRYFDEVGFEQHGVLHGDVKPANILVREDDSPVLVDFMMVDLQRLLDRAIVPAPDSGPVTAAFGTPNYMAPEQEERGIVTVKTDIFGLGKSLYELFFPHDWQLTFEKDFARMKPEPDESWPEMRQLLRRMTDKNPENRPRKMSVVVEELERIAASMNIALP